MALTLLVIYRRYHPSPSFLWMIFPNNLWLIELNLVDQEEAGVEAASGLSTMHRTKNDSIG